MSAAGGDPTAHPVVVGRVGKPFGVNGEVYVHSDPDLDEPFEPGAVCASPKGGHLVVSSVRSHKSRLVVGFDGVEDREGAEALRGRVLTRPRDELRLADGGVWIEDLVGRQVVDDSGGLVGVVEAVTDGHAHDYLVLARPDGAQTLVPMVPELVDWSGDPVVVTPIPGLLDPDEAS